MQSCIDTDSGHSTFFQGLAGHLCSQPLLNSIKSTNMPDPVVIDFIKKTFDISAYTLLYVLGTFVAGVIGRLGAYVGTRWIFELFIPHRVKANRVHVEGVKEICILICGMGYLVVAVGLLFMHLAGGLPHEYDELAAQIGVALFGEIVFVCLCLVTIFAGFCVGTVLVKTRALFRRKAAADDEETGLLKNSNHSDYGSPERPRDETVAPKKTMRKSRPRPRQPHMPKALYRPWIKMRTISSVRDLDSRRFEGRPDPSRHRSMPSIKDLDARRIDGHSGESSDSDVFVC